MTSLSPEFRSTTSLDETLQTLAELGPDGHLLAGGTDVMRRFNRGGLQLSTLVHIARVPGLAGIRVEPTAAGEGLAIGSLATHWGLQESTEVGLRYPALVKAASLVGGWQTQATGTVGGNLGAADAADLVTPLMVHGAVVELASVRGTRSDPIESFVTGRRTTSCLPDELVTGVRLEPVPTRTAEDFVKVGRRGAMERSIVAVTVRLTLMPDSDAIADARIAVAGAAPAAYRAHAAEELLRGQVPGEALWAEVAAAVTAQADPVDDVYASRSYRLRVLPRVVTRSLRTCVDAVHRREERKP